MSTPIVQNLPLTHKDQIGARIGMWLFLITDVLLFGGLFLLYAVYRTKFPEDFHYCTSTLDPLLGGFNTIILLTASLTMVMAVFHMERRNRKMSAILLMSTIGLALLFLINKYIEWSPKISQGLYPNSEILQAHTPGENIYYGIYYLITGIHGLHILAGILLLIWLLVIIARNPREKISVEVARGADILVNSKNGEALWKSANLEQVQQVTLEVAYQENETISNRQFLKLENAGLYWHLVVVIWIFLFPLLYLIS